MTKLIRRDVQAGWGDRPLPAACRRRAGGKKKPVRSRIQRHGAWRSLGHGGDDPVLIRRVLMDSRSGSRRWPLELKTNRVRCRKRPHPALDRWVTAENLLAGFERIGYDHELVLAYREQAMVPASIASRRIGAARQRPGRFDLERFCVDGDQLAGFGFDVDETVTAASVT